MRLALTLALLVPAAVAASPTRPRVTLDARLLGLRAAVREVPAAQRGQEHLEFAAPRHVEVTLGPQDGSVLRVLNVYPVAGLMAQYPSARDGVRTEIVALRALLRGHPSPNRIRGELPFLPLVPAAQLLHGAVKSVDFSGGRGVRYLVAYSQEVAPVTRAQVFYTFQGLTNDGQHYVSLQYDLPLRELPQDTATPDLKGVKDALYSGDQARADVAWKGYVARTQRQLDGLTNDTRLTRLDRFIGTLQVR